MAVAEGISRSARFNRITLTGLTLASVLEMAVGGWAGYRRPMSKASKAVRLAALALAFGVGGICLAAALLAQGGRFDPRLDLLAHFAPFWLAGALVTVVAAMGVARRGTRGALLALGPGYWRRAR